MPVYSCTSSANILKLVCSADGWKVIITGIPDILPEEAVAKFQSEFSGTWDEYTTEIWTILRFEQGGRCEIAMKPNLIFSGFKESCRFPEMVRSAFLKYATSEQKAKYVATWERCNPWWKKYPDFIDDNVQSVKVELNRELR